jgi:hypothetical protein
MSTTYHESGLSKEAQAMHRALASMIEELEAVDWYNQRADVAEDEELKKILLHNRNEEIEHASMLLEWVRRRIPEFDEELKTYLFTKKSILEIEEDEEEDEESSSGSGDLGIR